MNLEERVAGAERRRAAQVTSRVGTALLSVWTGGRPAERVAYVVAGLLLASGLLHLGVLVATGGTWLGPVSMRKPATFGLSFGLTLATVARVTSLLTMNARTRTVLLAVFSAVSVLETGLIAVQAWRGVPSHVNFETPFDAAVSTTLAGGGGVVIACVLAFATAALRGAGGLVPSMRLAVRSGFALLVVGLVAGAVMIATGVGEARTGDPLLAYSNLGTLKPVHGVALHAVLVLPALAWLLGAAGWNERRRMRAMRAGAGGYAALVAVTAVVSVL